MFKPNESQLDRYIRLFVGVITLLLGLFILHGTIQIIALVVGTIGLFTGYTGFCLLYKLFGIKTNK